MARRWFPATLVAALALPAAAAATQPGPAAENPPEIVVTGTRDMDEQVRDFVGALTEGSAGRIARFEAAICPAAVGVSVTQKQALAARIGRIAAAAGIAVGKDDCRPNVLLIVTARKDAFIEALLKSHPEYFGKMSDRAVRKLARAAGPAAVWHVDGPLRDADGEELAEGRDGGAINRTTRAGSRLTEGARPQFAAAAVVVEANALDGLTTTQLADYAAMRALSRSDPSKLPGAAPTILKVLEAPMGEEVPITMTEWDLAFLRNLYQAPANVSAAAQRSGIRRGVQDALEKGEGEKR